MCIWRNLSLRYQSTVDKSTYLHYINKCIRDVSVQSSIPALAQYALYLEDLMLVDRLNIEFLQSRKQWRDLIIRLYAHQGNEW